MENGLQKGYKVEKYHKIQTVFKRNPVDKYKTLLMGEFSTPEFEYLQNNVWTFSEKINGTNLRTMYNDGIITFAGKTDKAQLPPQLLSRMNEKATSTMPQFVEVFGNASDVCLYSEGYGAGIQSGGNYRPDQDFVLFDIKIGRWWLKRKDIEDIAKKLSIDIVPIIGEGNLNDMVKLAKSGFTSRWGDFIAEGIVARPKVELKSRNGERIITKIKFKDFNH